MNNNDPSHQNAKRVTHAVSVKRGYRSQVGRKYNAKHRAASAKWCEGKGFQTRQEKLENPKDLTLDPTSDVYQGRPTPNTGPANEQELRYRATAALTVPQDSAQSTSDGIRPPSTSTAKVGFFGNWFDMSRLIIDGSPLKAPYVPEIPAAPDPSILPEGCSRRVYRWSSGNCYEWNSSEPIQVVSRDGRYFDAQGVQVHLVYVAAQPPYMAGLPQHTLNPLTGEWIAPEKPTPTLPLGESSQKFGRTAAPNYSLVPKQPCKPKSQGGPGCTCTSGLPCPDC